LPRRPTFLLAFCKVDSSYYVAIVISQLFTWFRAFSIVSLYLKVRTNLFMETTSTETT